MVDARSGRIPARLSSALPHKPLQLLAGEPLIVRVARHVAGMGLADRVVVATDAEEVARVVRDSGLEVAVTRPTTSPAPIAWPRSPRRAGSADSA
jgi:CMP-2-keto-3-deoxyoctulosonic acid synthetase